MRWLVAGSSGMLGQDLVSMLEQRGEQVTPLALPELDVIDPQACIAAAAGHDVVVNCTAYTAVDAAESDEASAFAVNAVGAANLARAAHSAGARMVHVSTDYVFEGSAARPYGEHDPIAPRSAYGRTKAAGEWAVRAEAPDHLLVRTAWLYGANGACFPRTIVRLLRERGAVTVVDDQHGQPTWTVDLADLVHRLVRAGAAPGTYHGTSSGTTSWWAFARAAARSAGFDPEVVSPTTADASARPAPRPSYSVLGHDALEAIGVAPIGGWAERWSQAATTVLS